MWIKKCTVLSIFWNSNMKTYKILEHTADIRLNVQASTLKELFIAALEGMSSIMKPSKDSSSTNSATKNAFKVPAKTRIAPRANPNITPKSLGFQFILFSSIFPNTP